MKTKPKKDNKQSIISIIIVIVIILLVIFVIKFTVGAIKLNSDKVINNDTIEEEDKSKGEVKGAVMEGRVEGLKINVVD